MSSTNAQAAGPASGQAPRDSKVWAGLMMTAGDSDDDSDSDASDDGQQRLGKAMPSKIPATSQQSNAAAAAAGGRARASWTTRAAAVGSRPPDTASQNPPTLKLLGLKSIKEGGAALGGGATAEYAKPPLSPALTMRHQVEQRRQEEATRMQQKLRVEEQRNAARSRTPSPAFDMIDEQKKASSPQKNVREASPQKSAAQLRVHSSSDYEDMPGRHGSMIAFGQGSDGFGAAVSREAQSSASRGYTLHDGPVPEAVSAPPQQRQPPPTSLAIPQNAAMRGPASPRTELTNQLGLGSRTPSPLAPMNPTPAPQGGVQGYNDGRPAQNPIPAPRNGSMPAPNSRNLVSPSGLGASPPRNASPLGQPRGNAPPPPALQLQQQSRLAPAAGGPNGPPPAQPIPLPSPVYVPPPSTMNGAPPRAPQGPMPRGGQGGSAFSDSPAPSAARSNAPARRPSLFRRSKAFLMGGGAMAGGAQVSQYPGGGGPRLNGVPPQQSQTQRRSLFRKSVAMLTGRGGMPQGQQALPDDDDANAPAPRVQGFVDEKPVDRRSLYLGGGGMGDEWDYTGSGSRFWKRFSIAQHKLQDGEFDDSNRVRAKVARRQRWTLWSSLIGGMVIIAAVVAIVIWRENVKTSDVPGALDRSKGGAGTDLNQALSSSAAAAQATATGSAASAAMTDSTVTDGTTTTKKHHRKHKNDNGNERRDSAASTLDNVRRQVEAALPASERDLRPLMMAVRRRQHAHMLRIES